MEVIENIIKDGSMPDYNVVSENETTALMEAGTVAMTFQGSWAIPELAENDYVKENCDIAPLPKDRKEQSLSITDLAGQHLQTAKMQKVHGN